jgi:hypothetical protein
VEGEPSDDLLGSNAGKVIEGRPVEADSVSEEEDPGRLWGGVDSASSEELAGEVLSCGWGLLSKGKGGSELLPEERERFKPELSVTLFGRTLERVILRVVGEWPES